MIVRNSCHPPVPAGRVAGRSRSRSRSAMACRVLLTTIPKCGKNVLVSFLSGLGMERQPGGADVFDAATHVQARWYARRSGGDPAQHDPQGFLSRTAPAFDRVLDGLAALPGNGY